MVVRQKGFSPMIVVLIVLLVAVIGFSAYVATASRTKEPDANIVPEQTVTKKQDSEVTDNEVASEPETSWTERSLTGFSISYPTAWQIAVCDDVVLLGSTKETTGLCQSGFGGQIMINKTTTYGAGTVTDTYYDDISESSTTINSTSCVVYKAVYNPPSEEGDTIPAGSKLIRYICTKDSDNVFVANYLQQPSFPDVSELFEELATQKWQF